jgi:hypothetical protein
MSELHRFLDIIRIDPTPPEDDPGRAAGPGKAEILLTSGPDGRATGIELSTGLPVQLNSEGFVEYCARKRTIEPVRSRYPTVAQKTVKVCMGRGEYVLPAPAQSSRSSGLFESPGLPREHPYPSQPADEAQDGPRPRHRTRMVDV